MGRGDELMVSVVWALLPAGADTHTGGVWVGWLGLV